MNSLLIKLPYYDANMKYDQFEKKEGKGKKSIYTPHIVNHLHIFKRTICKIFGFVIFC